MKNDLNQVNFIYLPVTNWVENALNFAFFSAANLLAFAKRFGGDTRNLLGGRAALLLCVLTANNLYSLAKYLQRLFPKH